MRVLTLITAIDHFGHTGAEETSCTHQSSVSRAGSHNAVALVCVCFFFSIYFDNAIYSSGNIFFFFSQCGTGFVMLRVGNLYYISDEEKSFH